jgi:hypothetical protein
MNTILLRSIGALAAFLLATSAWGATLTWTLNNWTFDSGAIATGSFDYTAGATNPYSNVSITIEGWFPISGYGTVGITPFEWDTAHVTLPLSDSDRLSVSAESTNHMNCGVGYADTCIREGHFFWDAPLTDNGGVITMNLGNSGELLNQTIEGNTEFSYLTTGTISAVPVPAAAWLFGSALAGLGWLRRKQTI